jgi:1,4-alpha-glucan branching enzyme
MSFISAHDIELICSGQHGDPFSILGVHLIEDKQLAKDKSRVDKQPALSGKRQVIRAFLPNAREVHAIELESKRLVGKLHRINEAGFFERTFDAFVDRSGSLTSPKPYRLKILWADGFETTEHDPYRFGSLLGDLDRWLFNEGTHLRPYEVLGAHPCLVEGIAGTRFSVWAPNASRVSVVGNFNFWDGRRHPMRLHPASGLWEIFLPSVGLGALYKFEIRSSSGHLLPVRADPYARRSELRPGTASIVDDLPSIVPAEDKWRQANRLQAPMSIYEVHLGSWRRKLGPVNDGVAPSPHGDWLNWDELCETLIPYAREMGFTHLELLPIHEHPFDGSWGYQPVGLYSSTSRFGDAAGLTRFISACHAQGLGVLLDWVPAHFPNDAHGLAQFDGTALYEYGDPREGFHKDWNTLIYDFGKPQVRSFLQGNSLYWLERFGIDGLRVDAVSSMLYRDYSRQPGEWIANEHGGRENLEAIAFLKRMNEIVGNERPEAMTAAEESTSFPAVSRPTYAQGLGFHYKWNMGWMHDTLSFMARDPIYRKHHHHEMTFGMAYAYSENFILPISHDEVVHGKGSLINKMPGDQWQKFANLRAYLGFMFTHPGKKLLFMGCEFAQWNEWNHDQSLDWHLLAEPNHEGVHHLVRDLNQLYRSIPALHELDHEPHGFQWIEANDSAQSVLSYIRRGSSDHAVCVVVCNFTPMAHQSYRLGVPRAGRYREKLNTDSTYYGGSNVGTPLAHAGASEASAWQGQPYSVLINLPPLATVVFEWVAEGDSN